MLCAEGVTEAGPLSEFTSGRSLHFFSASLALSWQGGVREGDSDGVGGV